MLRRRHCDLHTDDEVWTAEKIQTALDSGIQAPNGPMKTMHHSGDTRCRSRHAMHGHAWPIWQFNAVVGCKVFSGRPDGRSRPDLVCAISYVPVTRGHGVGICSYLWSLGPSPILKIKSF